MAQQHDVDCPSGLSVTIREFRVSDEDLLADPRASRKGAAVNALLEQITIGVSKTGPYTLRNRGDMETVDWNDVLQGDRMTVLLKNRIVTWGEEMDFKLPCENCAAAITMTVDLNDLKIKPLPKSSMAHAADPTANPLTVALPGGSVVSFRLLRGKDDKALQRLKKQHSKSLSSAYLRFRVTAVKDVPSTELKKWLSELGGHDASFLRNAFDEFDCGVDQAFLMECDSCGHEFEEDVKFGSDFLFPKYRAKT